MVKQFARWREIGRRYTKYSECRATMWRAQPLTGTHVDERPGRVGKDALQLAQEAME